MSKQVKLRARPRAMKGSSAGKKLRREGRIPANMYGSQVEPRNLEVAATDLRLVLGHAIGEQILVELEIQEEHGEVVNRLALIQEVQHEAISGAVLHVDFHAIASDEKLHAEVPIEPIGEPIGVKDFGGLLEQSMRHVEITCLPKDLPEVIVVDVSGLNVGESIHVSDLQLAEGVTALADPHLTVFGVMAPRVVTEETPAVTAEAPEVIKEKKKDEEESEK